MMTNASHGVRQTLDNVVLNVALNFVTGIEVVDRFIRASVLKVTSLLGLNRYRSDTERP